MKSRTHSYIGDIAALRSRCKVDHATGCWEWLGATSSDGVPRLHTFDHKRGEKRTMSGPKAAWNVAHQRAPLDGWIVGRRCGNRLCMCPVHLAEFRSQAALGEHIRRAGWRVGTHVEQRRASQRLAALASGKAPTPEHVVRAIRCAPMSIPASELARLYGIAHQTASRIRRGQSHRGVR